MANNNDYPNIIVCGVYETRNGHYNTLPIDAKAYDTIQRVLEQGGKFLIRKRSQESMDKAKNPNTTPTHYLEFVPAAEVERFSVAKMTGGTKYGL